MKYLLFALALISAPAFATATGELKLICNLADLSLPIDKANIFTVDVAINGDIEVALPSYKGRDFSLSNNDLQSHGREITISARRSSNKNIVASASGIFNNDAPEVLLQVTANLVLRCSQPPEKK